VVLAMVLHHCPTPAQLAAAAAQALGAKGALLIAELSPHEQAWVGDACGDLWLGIEPEQQDRWAAEGGALLEERQFLTLRNGFQIHLSRYERRDTPLGAAEARSTP
jgi:ArsR family transcriptional regulator